ncbi:RNA polymerase sigma factor [Niabella beijingensis]|uniref:RNA polymerase sigma factor n=1 Tax=Niabella beijingensis TaxID=2872700 RepID=UPI001CBA91F0|nr:RNA polymerase sigma-70 factor [Niabella beijingensis]MBZ4192484.1 RNA polymerase sigma-70 factor [Niabella beijingensis]
MKTIEKLVVLVAEKDDQAAFNDLFRHFFPGLFPFVLAIVKDKQRAEELIHDVFLKLWENRKMLTAIQNISSYIFIASRHACISFTRKRKQVFTDEIADELVYTMVTPETDLVSTENMTLIEEAIRSLPPKCLLIFRLIKEEQLKYTEVARLLDISVKTVETQMMIANKRVAAALLESLPEYSSNIPSRAQTAGK